MATPALRPLLLSCSLLILISSLLCCLEEGFALEERKTTFLHHHAVEITSLLPSSVCNPSTKATSSSSLKVVHRHGPCSRNAQEKPPTVAEILTRDQSRVSSIHSRLAKSNLQDFQSTAATTLPAMSGASLNAGNYVVTLGLGTPKRSLSLIFDTGSDLTWTQCQPCVRSCYKQKDPIFDPSRSSSYSNISCASAVCSRVASGTGNTPSCAGSTCVYGIQYGDQSFSVGYFAKDKLTLTSTDVVNGFLFGCGQYNDGLFGLTDGLLGLGRDPISMVSQTGKKYGKYFSYCLPSSSSNTGHLTFGKSRASGNSSSVVYTPFASPSRGASFYWITVTGITVGGKTLPISSTLFSGAGTIIDSGTVITRLPKTAYTALRTAFRKMMTRYPLGQPLSILDTCYDLSNFTTVSIPKVGFLFSGKTKLDIPSNGILYAVKASQVCLAFAGNGDDTNPGILGNVQQLGMEVVYDVAGGKLGFGAGGCS